MRRLLLLAAVAATQLATGCYSAYPVFPRLHTGFGCGFGGCGTPILNRPVLAPSVGAPVYPTISAGGDMGVPFSGGMPIGGGPISGVPMGGCAGCGSGGVTAGYPQGPVGVPLPTTPAGHPADSFGYSGGPVGSPYSVAPHGYPGVQPAPMPMVMPSAMPGGVPHDSALLKMPTIVPPGPPTVVKRPEELARTSGGSK